VYLHGISEMHKYLLHILLSFGEFSHHSRPECRRNKEMNKRFPIFGSADMNLQPRANRDWLQSSAVVFSIDCSLSSSSFKCWGVLLFIRKVVLSAKANIMNHDYLTPMRLTVNMNTFFLHTLFYVKVGTSLSRPWQH
jgi:hypothetical protein